MDVDDDSAKTRARLETVQPRLERRLAGEPGVLGIGIGSGTLPSGLAFRVYVKDKGAGQRMPKHFEGVEVISDVVKAIKAR
jgi:hypothetical protein